MLKTDSNPFKTLFYNPKETFVVHAQIKGHTHAQIPSLCMPRLKDKHIYRRTDRGLQHTVYFRDTHKILVLQIDLNSLKKTFHNTP